MTEIIHKAVTVKAPVKDVVTHKDLETLRANIMQDFEDMYDRVFEKAFKKAFDNVIGDNNTMTPELCELYAKEKVIAVPDEGVDEQAEDHE